MTMCHYIHDHSDQCCLILLSLRSQTKNAHPALPQLLSVDFLVLDLKWLPEVKYQVLPHKDKYAYSDQFNSYNE